MQLIGPRIFPGKFPEISQKVPGTFPDISWILPGQFGDFLREFRRAILPVRVYPGVDLGKFLAEKYKTVRGNIKGNYLETNRNKSGKIFFFVEERISPVK